MGFLKKGQIEKGSWGISSPKSLKATREEDKKKEKRLGACLEVRDERR